MIINHLIRYADQTHSGDMKKILIFLFNISQKSPITLILLKRLNLVLRSIMETGIVAGLGYWGFQTGKGSFMKIFLAVCIPVIIFGFWGLVDFHKAGRFSEPLRLLQELVISGAAAVALYIAEQHFLGWTLAGLSIVHHILVYLIGDKLLK